MGVGSRSTATSVQQVDGAPRKGLGDVAMLGTMPWPGQPANLTTPEKILPHKQLVIGCPLIGNIQPSVASSQWTNRYR